MDMMPNYDIRDREKNIADWFIAFETDRILEEEKPPEEQDPNGVNLRTYG